MWFLLPAWNVALDEAKPYLAGFALNLGTVCFELGELVGDLDLAEDGRKEGIGYVAYIFQHVYVLDQPGFGQREEGRDWHLRKAVAGEWEVGLSTVGGEGGECGPWIHGYTVVNVHAYHERNPARTRHGCA